MAGVSLPDMRPWGRRPLSIPPTSPRAWLELAMWELWMGTLVCIMLGGGALFIVMAPDRIIRVSDLTNCYAPPPVAIPCARVVLRGGVLNAAFTALFGVMLIGAAVWLLWELWRAVEPRPITDDFLRLLHDSFGRDWRNPLKWPWARIGWAYGFTAVGALMMATVGMATWLLAAAAWPEKAPAVRVDTSESFTVGH